MNPGRLQVAPGQRRSRQPDGSPQEFGQRQTAALPQPGADRGGAARVRATGSASARLDLALLFNALRELLVSCGNFQELATDGLVLQIFRGPRTDHGAGMKARWKAPRVAVRDPAE